MNRLLREYLGHVGHVSLDSVLIKDRVRSGQDRVRLFPKSPDYKYVPFVIRKRERHHVSQTTTLGASPPLILGFHPSKRHAALIAPCDQGNIVLALYLGITRTEAFFMASSTSYHDVRRIAFSRSIVLCCLSSTNIMLSLCSHVSISC